MEGLFQISPVDGRYVGKTKALQLFFSEFGLIRYRVQVEIEYLIALVNVLPNLPDFSEVQVERLNKLVSGFSEKDAIWIKEKEKVTNHDVKAVEYWIKEQMTSPEWQPYLEFVHFGLTSQDINNTATPMLLRDALHQVVLPLLREVIDLVDERAEAMRSVPMLARTHGQPASPTTMGKEWKVFATRLDSVFQDLHAFAFNGKFGGATGNFNAHLVAYPDIDWFDFANVFLRERLQLNRSIFTTQIDHYDNLAGLFHAWIRLNTIWVDFCRDIWTYVSMEYFRQKAVKNEVGSSAMPHKVNPIDFENAEGNLGMANAILGFLAEKLPVSRLQRDLTDSTVLRNIGVPMAHIVIALQSIRKGISKLQLNEQALSRDLNSNWAVLAEAIQTILRREGVEQPYEKLKDLTRGQTQITQEVLHQFIDGLDVDETVKWEMKHLTPSGYVGGWDHRSA
ncbi:MAG: adenylosuccinate lyase [Saprospiraceae bacterium]|nr:adenylosuccinate lyase [Saprospiraceae bacterium]